MFLYGPRETFNNVFVWSKLHYGIKFCTQEDDIHVIFSECPKFISFDDDSKSATETYTLSYD